MQAEIKKLYASKIWWIIIAGSFLPGVITYLSFFQHSGITWLEFFHVALLIYNVQSLLTFSAFAAFLCAREYEENTIEITLCYPYKKYYFLAAKLIIMFFIIGITTLLFAVVTLCFGAVLLSNPLPLAMAGKFIIVLFQLVVMHSLLMPAVFFIAMVSRFTMSGIIWGIINMCLCMMLYHTSFIQFIPPCIPFVLADHLLGMDVMVISPHYLIHWSILAVYYVLLLTANFIFFKVIVD